MRPRLSPKTIFPGGSSPQFHTLEQNDKIDYNHEVGRSVLLLISFNWCSCTVQQNYQSQNPSLELFCLQGIQGHLTNQTTFINIVLDWH